MRLFLSVLIFLFSALNLFAADFYVYNKDTGEILRHGNCPRSEIAKQAMFPSEVAVEGPIQTDKQLSLVAEDGSYAFKVVGGSPVYSVPEEKTSVRTSAGLASESKLLRRIGSSATQVLFEQENRLRKLEGIPAITWEQFLGSVGDAK